MTAAADSDRCPHCGSENATRRMSRFARGRSEDDLVEDLADPSTLDDVDDPKAMRRWAKEISSELGEDLGEEFDQYMDAAEEAGDEGGEESG